MWCENIINRYFQQINSLNLKIDYHQMLQSRRQNNIKPIQLISFDNDKKLMLSPQAISLFQKFQAEQLHIVTVAGKYRTGKSYILNRVLLNQNSGFEVGPTINACTKGLWIWPQIVDIKFGDIVKKCLIIDTEGLGSLEQGENTDIKIFLMAILLSSYLIYNSVGNIDQKALENLSLITNLAQLLHKNQNQYDSQQLINSFPSFMWLVRDFSLRLQSQRGEPITSQQYLQNALKYQNSSSAISQRKNSIRKKLKTFFQDRNCFTLIRPTQNEKDLQNLSALPDKRLRPEFIKLIGQLKTIISQSLKPKKVRGKSVTPQGFIQLCKYFVLAINSGKIPSINSHWDNLCLKQASRIMQTVSEEHTRKLKQCYDQQGQVEVTLKKMEQTHKAITKLAFEKIEKSFLGKLEKQLCKEKIDKMLEKGYYQITKQINEHRYNFVKEIVKEIFSQIMDEFQNNKLQSFQQIFARFEEIKQKYKNDTRIYESFYENSKDVFQEFLKNLKQQWSRQQLVLNEKNEYLSSVLEQKTQEMKIKIQEYSEICRELSSKNYRIELQNSQFNQLIEDLKKQILRQKQQNLKLNELIEVYEEQKYRNQQESIQKMSKNWQEQINQLKDQLHKAQIQLTNSKQLCRQSNIKERKTLREMEIFKSKCSEYLKQNIDLNEKLEKANKKLIEAEQFKRKQFVKDYSENKETSEIIEIFNSKINELQIRIKMKEEQNKNLMGILNSQKIANEALLKNPQNLNYSILKKNYEIERQTNKVLIEKIKEFQLVLCIFSFKCLLCGKKIDKNSVKAHSLVCSEAKSIYFDVSYEYNGNGEIQFVIDSFIDDQQWTIQKTVQNVKHFLKKIDMKSELFQKIDSIEEDIALNQQRRCYLNEVFNEQSTYLWQNVFLIQFFGVDLHYLNCKNNAFKSNSMKSSKISICLQENIQPINALMKTTKFNKKTFNFGNI